MKSKNFIPQRLLKKKLTGEEMGLGFMTKHR